VSSSLVLQSGAEGKKRAFEVVNSPANPPQQHVHDLGARYAVGVDAVELVGGLDLELAAQRA